MKNKKTNLKNFAIASGLQEIVNRYGSAGAEFIKGYRGIDYEIPYNKIERGLKQISQYKIGNENSVKQHAGFAAEVAKVSRGNAKNIINKSNTRFSRSEDLEGFGKNNPIVDIVEYSDERIISQSQMKFVNNPKTLLRNIAEGENGRSKDLSRYLANDKLELPTEQVEEAKVYCRKRAKEFLENADVVEKKGKHELAQRYRKQAKNYEKLETQISDAGMTREQAENYFKNPKWETTKDIANVSHKAGIEGAKFGAAIGGSISLITNSIAIYSNDKDFSEALLDIATDTLTSAGVGYLTSFSGSTIKGILQQSSSQVMRNLSKSGLPTMVVSTCLAASKSLYQYSSGKIELEECFTEIGATLNGMLSSATFSMLGQIALPIPVIGGLIGGMVGHTLTNSFYHELINSRYEVNLTKARREIIEMQCAAVKELAEKYQKNISKLFTKKLIQLDEETKSVFAALNNPMISADEFGLKMNKFAELLGKDLPYKTQEEFDSAMLSTKTLIL